MVLPIIIGIGITVAALTVRASTATIHRFSRLTPPMIATLNKIRLERSEGDSLTQTSGNASHIRYLKSRFDDAGFLHTMTEGEALLVLGIEAGDISSLTKDSIRQRYRKLMIQNHPDKQGSMYMSQKINQAKEILEKSYLVKK